MIPWVMGRVYWLGDTYGDIYRREKMLAQKIVESIFLGEELLLICER